jgi:hypothetical protein
LLPQVAVHFAQVLQTREFGNLLRRQRLPNSYATLRTFVASDPLFKAVKSPAPGVVEEDAADDLGEALRSG